MKRLIFIVLTAIPISLLAQNGLPSKIDQFKAEKLFLTGLSYYDIENYRTALDFFNQTIGLNNEHQRVYELIGETYFKLGDYNSAIENYQVAAQQDDTNAELRNSMGVSAAYLKQYRAAASFFNEALRIDPEHKGARTNLGIANQRLEEIGEEPFGENDYPISWNNNNTNNNSDWNNSNNDWDNNNQNGEWDFRDNNDNPLLEDNENPLLQDNNDEIDAKPLTRTYSKSEIEVGNQTDPYISIERIKFTETTTRITFVVRNISGKVFPIDLDRKNGSNALYITDRGFQKIYKLRKIYSLNGWPQKPYPLRPGEKKKLFTAEFDRLDDDVEIFHILEGKSDRAFTWDFWDIEFKEIP